VESKSKLKSKVTTIILAAGASSRMGQSKQKLNISGEPLLRRIVQAALSSRTQKVIVVLGADESGHHNLIRDLPVEIIVNHNWQKGMGSSIKRGMDLISIADSKAVIISVCDQPHLTSNVFNQLIDLFNKSQRLVVASTYAGTMGVPALFHQSLFNAILNMRDDEGAKKIILKHQDNLETIPFEAGAIDLDTMTDYDSFIRQSPSS
jgi:molybdenum cofactor cytidylyltransferase